MSYSLPDFSKASVCVIGDIMLDEYYQGGTHRVSPEAPVPVVLKNSEKQCLGGAANVAHNLAKVGVSVGLSGIMGKDSAATLIQEQLKSHDIQDLCLQSEQAQTIHKLRIMSRNQQLLRIDSEETFNSNLQEALTKHIQTQLENFDAIILSDYAKGTLGDTQALIQAAKASDIPVLVDPKGTDFERYTGASALTPNLSEFELVMGKSNSEQEFQTKAEELREKLDLNALIVTLSEKGVALFEKGKPMLHIPTEAREVYDVTGAGDTVIAVIAATIAAKQSFADAVKLGNTAAGIVVGKIGTSFVTPEELNTALTSHTAKETTQQNIITDYQALKQLVDQHKANNKKVVMTNGCFDLLHPGHITYLQEAAALGDILIIAVNNDDSVKRLKGDSRPINPLNDRMTMLNALKGVDIVTAFTEDTPQNVINVVLPDVLVKGGDYVAEDIVGYQEVTKNGGEVKILSFKDGYSSTRLINKISSNK